MPLKKYKRTGDLIWGTGLAVKNRKNAFVPFIMSFLFLGGNYSPGRK